MEQPVIDATMILDNMSDGVYVTDTERRIIYWSEAAERITGWGRNEVIGRHCRDNILAHVDKNGNNLCGKENCPLHRALVTGHRSQAPVIVFARSRNGRRIPMQVTVAPLRDEHGEVVAAIEVFRDLTHIMTDLERARAIQRASLSLKTPDDPRVRFQVHYAPTDMIGGDFYSVESIDSDRTSIFIADVMGHGVSSALYSVYFRQLLTESRPLLIEPAALLPRLDARFSQFVNGSDYFATAAALVLDARTGELHYAGAGHPSPIIFRRDGSIAMLNCAGRPLGLTGNVPVRDSVATLAPGESLLVYTDGATEVEGSNGHELGDSGLASLVRSCIQKDGRLDTNELEDALLDFSAGIRLEDDVTMVWCHYRGP